MLQPLSWPSSGYARHLVYKPMVQDLSLSLFSIKGYIILCINKTLIVYLDLWDSFMCQKMQWKVMEISKVQKRLEEVFLLANTLLQNSWITGNYFMSIICEKYSSIFSREKFYYSMIFHSVKGSNAQVSNNFLGCSILIYDMIISLFLGDSSSD